MYGVTVHRVPFLFGNVLSRVLNVLAFDNLVKMCLKILEFVKEITFCKSERLLLTTVCYLTCTCLPPVQEVFILANLMQTFENLLLQNFSTEF